MTVFTRNEKVPETGAVGRAPAHDDMPMTAPPAARSTQAVAQTFSTAATPQALMTSVISKALKITGQLESTEDIRIEGEVDGDVRGVSVTVGPNAKVTGVVYGDAVELAGTVDGKIEAKKVFLTSTARMSGDVVHQEIKIESGAFIDGHCRPEYGKSESKNVPPVHKPVVAARELTADKTSQAGVKV